MAGEVWSAKVEGLAVLARRLGALPNKLRRGLLRNALAAGGRVFRDEARAQTPVLAQLSYVRGAVRRQPGTVRKAITVRTSKDARRSGNVGVYINVRPAKGAARGGNNPRDPFYWRWLEFGTKAMHAFRMLQKAAASKSPEALVRIEASLGEAVQKLNTPTD